MSPAPHYRYVSVNAWKFNLLDLLILTAIAAVAFTLASQGMGTLGLFLLMTVIAFRTAIFDFSLVGHLATLLTMIFGSVSLAILVLWSAGF